MSFNETSSPIHLLPSWQRSRESSVRLGKRPSTESAAGQQGASTGPSQSVDPTGQTKWVALTDRSMVRTFCSYMLLMRMGPAGVVTGQRRSGVDAWRQRLVCDDEQPRERGRGTPRARALSHRRQNRAGDVARADQRHVEEGDGETSLFRFP
jgi:hypothetical protein